MKTQVILAAAGDGVRLKSDVLKPFVRIQDKPMLLYSLEVFARSSLIDSVIVLTRADWVDRCRDLVEKSGIQKVSDVLPGGKTRCESVRQGLAALDTDTKYVLIHDAARPLITQRLVEESLRVCYDEHSVILGVPVKPTIKKVRVKDSTVEATLDRSQLWEAQTPQVFRKDIILAAHARADDLCATDDAFLVERCGHKVKVLRGDYFNIKITSPEDLVLAELLLRGPRDSGAAPAGKKR
ncbi:MAG TPA: 2-C-methyl-D-erythritol 4-phosphate cytidylyltransferase [Candidatus Omnitrophota bacterium]|nr:2-C-methyl-D-erythritol 4-phosphate cytidylyltransferase [Candidatus Omnitrophota bacterium]HPB67769.1 2-C-methyl-D-erythritol 4-phosphate cytidylyltransferase [Candidatus Omnitrophota bacterium]HQO57211.1 2-C-methyl-D-erythritol 4-phosphate cytidylyltransferase [Candidatus Omnitrophota bacterium]HQP12596.1 2-C-methyl-D-erythritol 4-phosphate cytidylyltransferase [Candidatus Omnitrophota bacterium]